MSDRGIIIKGNKDGLNIVINMDKFNSFDDMLSVLMSKLIKGKKFYKESTLYITTNLSDYSEDEVTKLKDILLKEISVK